MTIYRFSDLGQPGWNHDMTIGIELSTEPDHQQGISDLIGGAFGSGQGDGGVRQCVGSAVRGLDLLGRDGPEHPAIGKPLVFGQEAG